ncbi:MAG: hypothetical protein EZS28_000899 [Streblomastix strix]|uniref:Reverse transcriptase domain-containing protein n=1 Tax=Streblomastix strix TaxID=222440 RepID=A0A5J4X905_9EUKA|nr:MAG: hypothetical protein EZS28_000899 [Streblomastix strix]
MDYATSFDLKSAFHNIIVSPNSIPYQAFNFNNNNYAYKAVPFETKHSPIFFAVAIELMLRQIRIHSKIRILNYCDDILLIHQDKQILKTKTMEIMRTLEQFGWTTSTGKYETDPKQIITFLGWIWNLKEMNIRMSEETKLKMIQILMDRCNVIYMNKSVKIRQLAALRGRLNFLRPQIKEASLYLMELDKAKTQALKTGSWDVIMTVNRTEIRELKLRTTTELWSNADIRQSNRINTTRLLERKRSRNAKQRKRNQSYLLQTTPFRASLQEDARSGNLDTFRQHNSSLQYWEMKSEGISDRKNKTGILSSEKTLTTNHNNPHLRKIELNYRLILVTMQIRIVYTEGWNDLNDLQDMELHATDRHIRNTIQQTNQQLCNSGSQ